MDSQIHSENVQEGSKTLSSPLRTCDEKINNESDDKKINKSSKVVVELRASLEELRKFREELDSLGKQLVEAQAKFRKEVATIKSSINKVVIREKSPENQANQHDLHLSEVRIQKWTVAKSNDSLALERVKQICSGLDGDSNYHYEDIDDFDDIDGVTYKSTDRKYKEIHCKVLLDENGVFQNAKACRGKRNQGKHNKANVRRYLLGEIARGKCRIRCCRRGCTNYYDPWDVVRCLDTKDAFLWYDTVAVDPFNSKSLNQDNLKQRPRTLHQDKLEHDIPDKNSSQQKKKWWRKKKSINLDESVETFKYECDTCLAGFDEDPDEGSTNCGHYNCRSCLTRYFEEQVSNMLTKIECPRFDCNTEFNSEYIIQLLSADFRYSYKHLIKLKKELQMKGKVESCQNGPHCDCKNCRKEAESWIEDSTRFGFCPSCNTLIEKIRDGSCNFVICIICGTEFCWICKKIGDEKFHMFECPIYGDKQFSKKRKIINYIVFGVGVTIGAPLLSGIILGTGAVFMGTVLAVGALSPPIYMAKDSLKYHKEQHSSLSMRRASMMAAGTLGVLGLPFLSAWGVKRTLKYVTKSTLDALDTWLVEAEMEEYRDRPVWTPPQVTQSSGKTSKVLAKTKSK